MNGKSYLLGLLIFALGVGAGAYGLRPAQNASSDAEGIRKLQALADVDLEDYYRLKTMEEKYRKADEILGKVMVIFLADLGLRVSKNAQNAAKEPLPSAPAAREERAPPPPFVPANAPSPPVAPKPVDGHSKRWDNDETSLLNLRDERDVNSMLRKLKIEDFDSSLKTTRLFTNRSGVLTALNGGFEGNASVRPDGKAHTWYIHVELAATMQGSQLRGNAKIRMLENGKVFSNSQNDGTIENFREYAGAGNAILVQASPQAFLQLYYLKELDQVAANIYWKASAMGGFEHIGSVGLKRAQ